jgi:hypothetical protein
MQSIQQFQIFFMKHEGPLPKVQACQNGVSLAGYFSTKLCTSVDGYEKIT